MAWSDAARAAAAAARRKGSASRKTHSKFNSFKTLRKAQNYHRGVVSGNSGIVKHKGQYLIMGKGAASRRGLKFL